MERKKRRKEKITRKKRWNERKCNEKIKIIIIINEKFILSSPIKMDANATISFSLLAGSSYLSISIFQVLSLQVLSSFIILIFGKMRNSFLHNVISFVSQRDPFHISKNVSILLTEYQKILTFVSEVRVTIYFSNLRHATQFSRWLSHHITFVL